MKYLKAGIILMLDQGKSASCHTHLVTIPLLLRRMQLRCDNDIVIT